MFVLRTTVNIVFDQFTRAENMKPILVFRATGDKRHNVLSLISTHKFACGQRNFRMGHVQFGKAIEPGEKNVFLSQHLKVKYSKKPAQKNHHISGSGWQRSFNGKFAQTVGRGRANVIKLFSKITSGGSTIC